MFRSFLPSPPPLPDEIGRLIVAKAVGRSVVESAWVGCWFDGAAKGFGLAIAAFVTVNLVVLNVALLVIMLRRRGQRHGP